VSSEVECKSSICCVCAQINCVGLCTASVCFMAHVMGHVGQSNRTCYGACQKHYGASSPGKMGLVLVLWCTLVRIMNPHVLYRTRFCWELLVRGIGRDASTRGSRKIFGLQFSKLSVLFEGIFSVPVKERWDARSTSSLSYKGLVEKCVRLLLG
jgi:hypothetical protein